jgi:predicted transcriptional regulator
VDRSALDELFRACGVPARLAASTIAVTVDAVVGALTAAREAAQTEGWHAPVVETISDHVQAAAARLA